ncbi:hypothetical protein SDC9_79807 [bioreactor metagenome]
MYIVKKIVDRLNGAINLTISGGTSWYIEIPMEGGEKDD